MISAIRYLCALPESAASVYGIHSAIEPYLAFRRSSDHQDTFRCRKFSCPLVENQKELDGNTGGIFLKIVTVVIVHRDSAQGHSPDQAWHFGSIELVGAYCDVGGLCEEQPLLVVRASDKILEPLFCESDLARIGLSSHECMIIRTPRCRSPMVSARSAGKADQSEEQQRFFH